MVNTADLMRNMMLNAGRLDALQNTAFSAHQVNKAAVESGQAMGYTLQVVEDPMADLMDSMEELSFQFEEKEMKTAGERKLGENRGPRAAYLTAVETWQKVMPDMPGGEFMERMLRNLRQAQANGQLPDARQLLSKLGEGSSDPSHQFAMLDILEQSLGEGDAALKATLASARRALEDAHGPEIRAGINLAEQINAQAGDVSETRELRDLYRSEVLGFKNPQECFRSLLASRGAGRMGEAVDFLIRGCGIDIASASPSKSPEELSRILDDLQCVNVLTAVMDKAGQLADKMQSVFGLKCQMDGEAMTGRILDFTEKPFVAAQDIAMFVSSCGVGPLLAQLYFCTGLVGLFRQLSSRLFKDEEGRTRLVDAGQEHLDGLVLLEEEEERREKEKESAA